MKEEIGKPKFEYKSFAVNPDVYAYIEENFKEEMKEKFKKKTKKQETTILQNYLTK